MSKSDYLRWVKTVLRQVLDDVSAWTEGFTNLGAYGHTLKKPTELLGSESFVANLYRKVSSTDERFNSESAVIQLPSDSLTGKKRVTGVPAGLKQSQVYPPAYAAAVYKEWYLFTHMNADYFDEKRASQEVEEEAVDWALYSQRCGACDWAEANLHELCELLDIPEHALL